MFTFESLSVLIEKLQQQEPEVSSYTIPTHRKQWGWVIILPLAFSLLVQCRTSAHGMAPLTSRVGSPTSDNLIWTVLHKHAWRPVFSVVIDPVKLTITINHHNKQESNLHYIECGSFKAIWSQGEIENIEVPKRESSS